MGDDEEAPAAASTVPKAPDAWRVVKYIALAVALGIILGGALLWLYRCACEGHTAGVCKMIADNPPWLLFTGTIAAPPVLLTWYWRTVHKEADIRQAAEDLQHARETAQREHNLATHAQHTDRFARAVELLGNPSRAIRLGGIYALERLAKDSARDRPTIIETLAAFVRMSTAEGVKRIGEEEFEPPGEDVKAAFEVLGRRKPADDDPPIQLAGTNLTGAMAFGARFPGAIFAHALLVNVNLTDADLSGTLFIDATLINGLLVSANLEDSTMIGANMNRADLTNTRLKGAHLGSAKLQRAKLTNVDLTNADLSNADLTDAYLDGAELQGACFHGAKVSKAALERAHRGGAPIKLSDEEYAAILKGTKV